MDFSIKILSSNGDLFLKAHSLCVVIAFLNNEMFQFTIINTNIIDSDDNWNLLLYKEAYHIKRSSPSLNIGLKASRELCLFS